MRMTTRARALSLAAVMVGAGVLSLAAYIVLDYVLDSRSIARVAAAHAGPDVFAGARIVVDLAQMRSAVLMRQILLLVAGGTLVMVIALAVAWRVARRIDARFDALRDSAHRLADGVWSPPAVPAESHAAEVAAGLRRVAEHIAEREAAASWLDTVLNSMADSVFVTDPDGEILRANAAATALTGWSSADLIGRNVTTLVAAQDRAGFKIERAAGEMRELTLCTRAGQIIPVSLSGSRIAGGEAGPQGCVFVAHDITGRKRAERRIRYLARYDSLTKVANRMQFQHSLQQAIARARRSETSLALLYLDLDQFKEINDTFGHAAGDRTLEILSERLLTDLPAEAMVGRLAGDEFGLFIENLPGDTDCRPAAAALARDLLEKLARPFHLGAQEVVLTTSLGIALCPHDADNVVDLIRDADAAMYHSKQNGGNSHSFFAPEMSVVAVERLMLKSKLRQAILRDEFVMLYQPKVDLRNGRVVGAEALLRWRLPAHGDIPPAQFIPMAEESNLISDIGEWVLQRVCRDYRLWQDQVPQPGRVSINLSLKQLRQAEFIPHFRSVFDEHGVSPGNFELEITESTLMTDSRRMMRLLDELRAMGVHLSIDDFGTGYSSLSALQQFPVGTLKIDTSFVRHSVVSREDATLIRTIIEMGRNLGLEVVAEGIETVEQLAYLRSVNCHLGQGRLFGDPMTSDDLLELLLAQARGDHRYGAFFA